jgi:type I restriction-modification system DNA methylase subunit
MTKQILNNLINNVNHENLVRFFRDRNSTFRPTRENLSETYDDELFTNGVKLGEVPFGRIEKLIVCAFNVTRQLTERSGKKAQYDLAKKIIRDRDADAGIFVFIGENGNFRFSLVYASYLGTKVDYSNFRRFTYFVSPELTNKTFIQRIGEGDFLSLESIKEAFSVERVTSQFFREFREVFDRTRAEFEKQNKHTVCVWIKSKYDDEEYQEQIKKFTLNFLGRIIFLYFLLRKGWIEDRSDYIRRIIEDRSNTNLYLDVFKPLFFDVFAKQPHERPPDVRAQYQNTPYLNGGLFEHSELEAQMEKEGKYILFSDKFIREIILDFFEAYNFTVDENSPDDQEVSIDPEMLGKVFENTLAEEERNQRGTFYTPREIVHFMVKDALSQFLCNETGISRTILDTIILNDGDVSVLSAHQIRHCDAKLEGIKVLDPAVGSGAFPVEMMQVLIDLRKRLNVRVGVNINEVALKKALIKNNLYGVDIDPGAIEVAKLRLWLALIVDYDKTLAEPLPNLDFQFRVGNSLQEKIDDIDIFNETEVGQIDWLQSKSEFEAIKAQMIDIKDQFYLSSDEIVRNRLKDKFDALESQLIHAVLEKYREQVIEQIKNRRLRNAETLIAETIQKIDRLEQRIQDGTYKLFKPDFHFSEVFDRSDEKGELVGGFDIVIANPPYGVKIDTDIRDWHGLGSRDSYGVFISTALKRFIKQGGVMSYIVSDTWLTIKTHKALRAQVLEKQLHKVIKLHQDCFDAVVNPCIVLVTNHQVKNSHLIAADLTNLSTRENVERMRGLLYNLDDHIGQSTPVYAVYDYDQTLIFINSNLPIFVGSPKLFSLMNDTEVKVQPKHIEGQQFFVRQIMFNNKSTELVRFGDIAEVKVGLQTGENNAYLFQTPESGSRYRNIEEFRQFILTDEELERIAHDQERRMKVIEKGIHKTRDEKSFDEDRWFGGRYIVPYDKGGASDTEVGWLPNYYVPTDFFIDWSTWAVNRIKTLTIKQRDGKGPNRVCSRFQNSDYYFKEGITFSRTGQYSPTFRESSKSVFDTEGSFIDIILNTNYALGCLASKLLKYLSKIFLNDYVHMQIDALKEVPLVIDENIEIERLVKKLISKQKELSYYKYLENEQKTIDKLVFELYGLDEDDIKEVETWYARRYPRLAHLCDIEDSGLE